jgi:hypothetical protein
MPRTLGDQGQHHEAKLAMVEEAAGSTTMTVTAAAPAVFVSEGAVHG